MALVFLCATLFPDVIGLIGGIQNPSNPYAAFVSSSGATTELILPVISTTGGGINSVAINDSGIGLLGGTSNTNLAFAAFVNPPESVTQLSVNPGGPFSSIFRVALNSSGLGLIGGSAGSNWYVAFVSQPDSVVPIGSLPNTGSLYALDMNDSGIGLIGGFAGNAYVAFVNSSGLLKEFSSLPTGQINSVAINSSELGLVGGTNGTNAYAAFLNLSGVVQAFSTLPAATIGTVSINNLGQGLIAGSSAYCAFVDSSGSIQPVTLAATYIASVSLNDAGEGLVGGGNGSAPYAAFVDSSGSVIVCPSLPANTGISSVAINSAGNGLIGGLDSGTSRDYAALVYRSGSTIEISPLPSVSGFEGITSVATFLPLLSHIPTAGLTGNNLALANYLNTYSPNTALYFVPSELTGTLPQALESAAPTRHAFDLFISDNNLFALSNSFTQHAQDMRHYWLFQESWCERMENNLTDFEEKQAPSCSCELTRRPYQLWLSTMGMSSSQKAQHQTSTFQPWSAGCILGFDAHSSPNNTYGLGVAYAYTYDHQKQHAGHSRIQQEYLFLYGIWDNKRFYGDVALWGGLFQINNSRKIEMTSFHFTTTSHPKGWQLAPHTEIGYRNNYNITTFEPFVMFDWVNNWQGHYQEHGSSPFNFGQKSCYSSFLRSEVGLRCYETIEFSSWRLVLQEKGSYVNRKPFRLGDVTAYLISTPGFFTVETLTTPQNLGVAAAEILFEPNKPCRPYGSVAYQGEFGSTYQSHQFLAHLGWNF